MPSTFTPNKNFNMQANGAPAWDVPLNSDLLGVDQAISGIQSFNLAGASGTITLTNYLRNPPPNNAGDNSYIPGMLFTFGAPAAPVTLIFPAGVTGHWVIANGCTGTYANAVIFRSASAGGWPPPASIVSHVYVDGSNVLPIGSTAQAAQIAMLGEIKLFSGSSLPTQWLFCDGHDYSSSAYPGLYSVIANIYGSGNGTTTNFNVPDLRGRVAAGPDNMGVGTPPGRLPGWANSSVGGGATVTLSIGHIPTHNHGGGDHIHTATQGDHQHLISNYVITGAGANVAAGSGWGIAPNTGTGFESPGIAGVTVATSGATIGYQGSGIAHDNVQPTIAINHIIYAGA